MGILESANLQSLYNAAVQHDSTTEEDGEHFAFQFWLNFTCNQFITRFYSLDCTASPNDSPPHKCNIVRQIKNTSRTMPTVLWMECQLPGDTVQDVETKALAGAKRTVESDDLDYVCVITTMSISFRVWVYKLGDAHLTALYGSDGGGDLEQYIDAGSETSDVGIALCSMIQEPRPLLELDVVPSPEDFGEYINELRRHKAEAATLQ
ncbi:hypothetical protein QQS21_010579 [Conoideocrella luteorostrata]|uniref:Uncharacterized protein n=1 Tax=Conoideocrella luteorostrata TaxID=1105319 RepID=A0AAJ0CEQ7_9HYPO|nr:hypothetical protein QQS21_010579 [Conoideocrella luteorostrata]